MTRVSQDQISFHDATIVDVTQVGTTISLKLADVLVNDEQKAAEVAVEGVESICRNDEPASDLHMEKKDGEVLTLQQRADHVVLVAEWKDYAARSQEIVVYELRGPTVALRVVQIGANPPS